MQFASMFFPQLDQAAGACIAILGGGGKTSLLDRLGVELAARFPRVLLTALTQSARHSNHAVFFLQDAVSAKLPQLFSQNNPLYIMADIAGPKKLSGIAAADLKRLNGFANCTVFECDGARNLPLKAHLPHDPVVPDFATLTVILIGADAVGTRLPDGRVHRPEIFQEKWHIKPGTVLNAEFIAEVVSSRTGYLEKVPVGMPVGYFINKADQFPETARSLALAIRKRTRAPVFWGSVQGDFWERTE